MRPILLSKGVFALVLAGAGALLQGCATVEENAYVKADTTRLFMDIRGPSDASTVILYLHGGPGSWLEGLLGFEAYPGPLLERRHIVAYLHQRGLLRSPEVPNSTQTIDHHVADVQAVVGYLHRRYPDKHIVLLGHSWGGVLALTYAVRHPEAPVQALIAVSTPIALARNEVASYETALQWARDNDRPRAAARLEAMGRPPYSRLEDMLAQRRWTQRALSMEPSPLSISKALDAGGFRSVDMKWTAQANGIAHAMYAELMRVDLRPDLPQVRLPLLLIAGGRDDVVMTAVTVEDLAGYGGPKQVEIFANAGHTLYIEQPEHFAAVVGNFLAVSTSK